MISQDIKTVDTASDWLIANLGTVKTPVIVNYNSHSFSFLFLNQCLNLHGNGLSRLQHVSCMTALKKLTVSFNELTRLDEIGHMVRSLGVSPSTVMLSVSVPGLALV